MRMDIKAKTPKSKLDGKTWLRYSISIWDDLVKTEEEKKLGHPASYPSSLVERLIDCYSIKMEDPIILDPFLGSGTTLYAAKKKGLRGIGFEIVKDFIEVSLKRLGQQDLFGEEYNIHLITEPQHISFSDKRELYLIYADARDMDKYLQQESVSIMITSPPYWVVHRRKRTADYKKERPYSDLAKDLGNIEIYTDFLKEMKYVYSKTYDVIQKGGYAIVNVMDIRYGDKFLPYHCNTIEIMEEVGFKIEDIIIWDRRKEYNNLRPLGYPHKFIVNKIHEYILVFRKQ